MYNRVNIYKCNQNTEQYFAERKILYRVYGSPRNKSHHQQNSLNERFLHSDLFLLEYFFNIFLTPNLTLRSWDNRQLERKSV
jgi:hypothetical protein